MNPLLFFLLLAGIAAATVLHAAEPTNGAGASASVRETARDTRQGAAETGEFMEDAGITTRVKGSLLAEKNLKALGIGVNTRHGVVTLSGSVPSSTEVEQAEDIARHVKGVKDVRNELHLKAAKNG